jgi:hypothetical protein
MHRPEADPERGSYVACPPCGSTHFHIETREREFALVCDNGHELRTFFVLTQPPVPAASERSAPDDTASEPGG